MIAIDVRADIRSATLALNKLQREQIPFAAAYALTQTAKSAQAALEIETRKAFDRPTRFTQNAFFTKPATKRNLAAYVKVKDEASGSGQPGTARNRTALAWMGTQIRGGMRPRKGFENALERANLLPSGWYAVPTRWAPLDAYGNVPASKINQILSQLRARTDSSQNESPELARLRSAGLTKSGRKAKVRLARYFVALPGKSHLAPGIWERNTMSFGSSIRPVFIFTQKRPAYQKRFRFYGVVDATIKKTFRSHFDRGIRLALATAR
jgi:hypothetical protein